MPLKRDGEAQLWDPPRRAPANRSTVSGERHASAQLARRIVARAPKVKKLHHQMQPRNGPYVPLGSVAGDHPQQMPGGILLRTEDVIAWSSSRAWATANLVVCARIRRPCARGPASHV